ncbi:AbrB/MazE/SpoVT family DNA-binding domain-containing protein [Methylobacter sp.]|uniref:AbrB/MazE/SpoVT family DNA-binding domain-containing protein n=2 Tax=Methylobacter sp. TaxID=2051955 RepID=UPI002617C3E6|nr:AbrB/MazE/SpoVT family DNA-binding domain-containing protein [Methylobacter sp.]
MAMQTQIKKWGNSAVVRLPATMLAQLNLAVGSPVDLKTEGDRLVIEPSLNREYKLSDLLDGITPENLHEAVDWGEAAGREVTA